MVLGLHYEDFYMVESSLEEMLSEPNAMNLFYYIYLYLSDGVKEKRTLNEKRGFYKIILYWVMRKFNEFLTRYNKENITEKMPVIPVIKGEFSKIEGSDIETVGYLQSGFKELKDIIKREGHKEKIGWRLSLQGIKLEPIELGYKGKSPIELLLEGDMSAILEILRAKNYTLEKVQEEIKASCLYFLAKGHFGLEFSVFLMEQSGLEVDQVLADYYCFTLRKDIRKKIAKYFKEKGTIKDSLISPFIAFQEVFAPIDSITIALRRKYAMSRVAGPMKRLRNLNNIWRGDSEKKRDSKGKPKNLMDLIEKASSYGHFIFEMDDLEEDEPGAAYMRKEYEMTRFYRGEKEEEEEERYGPGHGGVFSVEEFRKNDRRMYEVNMKMSFRGKDKFKPRASGKKKSQEKLERYCQEIFKGYLGRGINLPAGILSMERIKESGYFQFKVKDVEEIDAKDMLGVLFEKLKLITEEILQIFEGLEKDQKRKYLEFLMEYFVERRHWKNIEEVVRWAMEKEEILFKDYFGIEEERIIKKVPECLNSQENMRRFMEIMVKKGYNVSEEVIGIKEMIGLLARNRMIMRGEMKGILRYLSENKLKFVVVSLLKGGCEVNIERFLEESGIKIPEEKAVILSIKGDEKAFGGIISLWEKEAGGLSVKSKDLYWEYKICGRKCGVGALGEKKEIPVFEVFRAGSLASYFLIGQISNTEDMSMANTKLEIENKMKFDGLKGCEDKTLEVRTISLMVQLGLPFAGFLSIFSDHPVKKLLLGETEAVKLADFETLARDLSTLNEVKKDMKTVYTILRICFKAVLQNPFNLDLFRSYLAFLKLLRLDPEPFLVNCLVYRRIFIFLGCKEKSAAEIFQLYYYSENFLQAPKELFVEFYNPLKSAPQQNQWVEEENKAKVPEILEKMSGYFLEVYSQNIRGYGTQKGYNKRGTHLIEILEQLEEATISMEEVMKGEKELIKEMESPWGLVSKFCTLHNIPSSLKLLEEISAKNDWLKLLLELDVQKCSIETAKEFIHKYFHHIVLKKHLINSLEEDKSPVRKSQEWIEEVILREIGAIRMDDHKGIIGVILKIREILGKYEGGERVRKVLGKGLVRLSEELNMEILCLMAEFVDEGEKEERYFKHLGIGRRRLQGEVSEIKGEEKWRRELGDLIYWCQNDMKELVKITRVYFGEKSWVEFIEGIEKIFEGNVLEMKKKFARFVKEYKEERQAGQGSVLLEARFIEMFVKNLIYNEIFTEEQALGVLEALCKIRLSKQMEDWSVNLGVLRKMPKRIRTKGLIFNSFKIYLLLLEGEMFEEAKEFSTRYGFSKSYLALIQAQKLLVSGLKNEGDHKGLIDQILVMLLKSEAKIYQTAYYFKYLTMKNGGLSLWDHIYLLNIAYRLMEKVTGEENEKFREKVRIQRDLLLYGNYWRDLRRYWFRNKERGHEKVLLDVQNRGFMKNVKVSDELEVLVVKNFLCGLSNFDCEYVERICERYGVMLLDNEIYAFWRDIEDILSGLVVKNIGLFEVLGLFGMAIGKGKIQRGEEFDEEIKKEKLKEVAQGYLRVRNGILIKENRENFEEYMKGYLYYCRLMRLCKGDFALFEFVSLREMSEFLQDLTLKKVFELLITSEEEQRQEILAIISWVIEHNQITHDELLSQYFDYCLEALCNYKPESLSFLERLNKTKRYDRTIENIQSFSMILASKSELQQTAGKICLNYLKNNEAPRYTQCIMLILAYFLISQDPKPLLNKLLGVSIQFIQKIVNDIGTRGGQKSHQEIWLDQVCLMVLGFEWHPCVLLGLSEALSKQKGLWKSLYGNFGKRWGYKFVEKMVMVGHSLPPLEAELLEQPVILGNLCYVRARKHLEALVGNGKRGCLIEKIEEIGGEKEVIVKDLSLIGEQLLCSHKYFMMARKSGLARKALNQLAVIYKAMVSVQRRS